MDRQEICKAVEALKQELQKIESVYQSKNITLELESLEKQTLEPGFWQQQNNSEVINKISDLKEISENLNSSKNSINDTKDLLELFKNDPSQNEEIEKELNQATKLIHNLKINLFLSGQYDKGNCFISITPGAGGTESQDWAEMLLRMYTRFCQNSGYSIKILDLTQGEEAGIKSATLHINGKYAYGKLKAESGIHRLVRISPFDSNKRRHTSFASILVVPEIEDAKIEIKADELKIETFRAGGAGGQHVNTTDSAVRLTHIPTGITAQCQNERSQTQNKQQALKILTSRLIEQKEREKQERQNIADKKKIEWGSQIRSYVLHPYKMVKDHRTNYESPRPELILDGEIEDFINAFLQSNMQKNEH